VEAIVGPPRRSGFSLIEVLVVITILGLIASFAAAPVARMRTSAALQSGRSQVTSALSLAQATAVRWGRTTTLSIDTVLDALTIRVDTAVQSSAPVVIRTYPVGEELGVELETDQAAVCYSARGVGTAASGCAATGTRLIIRSVDRADTVLINSAGRVWR
jgi:prepilin-type N-terminal cleavage/methylation domain-containing protein